jgi:hypothetical protein
VVPLNVSPAHTPKVYHLTEVEQRAKMGSESLERNNDSGRGRSHVAMQPGSMVGNDQYLMRNPNVRIRTVLVRSCGAGGMLSTCCCGGTTASAAGT